MISIIICHHNIEYLSRLIQNIKETIGIEYEVIIIENLNNKYNIFEAYNLGVKKSKYDILCFAHEDILFHTQDWGKKVINYFINPNVGIIGVAGSHYVPKIPGGWWCSGISSGNVIHTIKGKTFHSNWGFAKKNAISVPAIIVDGLWFCIPKVVMKQVRFDDANFKGFHCYDQDICMQIQNLKYEAQIVFDVTIEHFSGGSRDINWVKNNFILYKKWKKELPLSTLNLSKLEIKKAHNADELVKQTKIFRCSLSYKLKALYFYLRWYSIRKTIVKKYPEINYQDPLCNSLKYIIKKFFLQT